MSIYHHFSLLLRLVIEILCTLNRSDDGPPTESKIMKARNSYGVATSLIGFATFLVQLMIGRPIVTRMHHIYLFFLN